MNDLIADAEVDESTAVEETEEVEENLETQTETTDESEDVQENETETESEEDEDQEVVEELEFNFGGKKLAVAKTASVEEVAQELQLYANNIETAHTKRSQAVAETTKSLMAREAAIQKLEGLHGETLDKYSRGIAIKQELDQLSQIDMNALWQSDPDRARRLSDTISQKQAQFNSVLNDVSQSEQLLTQAQHEEMGRRMYEGKKQVESRIPGFEAKASEVMDYVGKEYGVPKEDAEQWALNPAGAEMAYKAMLYDRMQSKVKTTAKPKAKPVTPLKPIKAKGKTQAKKLSEIKDPDEYEKRWRQLQQKQGGLNR